MARIFNYGIDKLTIGNAIALATGKLNGVINAGAGKRIETSHDHVKQIVENNKTVYGINTGFGIHAGGRPLSDPDRTRQAARRRMPGTGRPNGAMPMARMRRA